MRGLNLLHRHEAPAFDGPEVERALVRDVGAELERGAIEPITDVAAHHRNELRFSGDTRSEYEEEKREGRALHETERRRTSCEAAKSQ